MSEEAGWSAFIAALRHAYRLARGERMNELKGNWVSRFDSRGLHPYSEAWGHINALRAGDPLVAARVRAIEHDDEITIGPVQMRKVAHELAFREFVERLDGDVNQLGSPPDQTGAWLSLLNEGEADG